MCANKKIFYEEYKGTRIRTRKFYVNKGKEKLCFLFQLTCEVRHRIWDKHICKQRKFQTRLL